MNIDQLTHEYLLDARMRGVGRSQELVLETVCHHLGHLTADKINPAQLRLYQRSRKHRHTGQPIQPGTLRKELLALQAVLRYAAKHELIEHVPNITLPPASPVRDRVLTTKQEAKLLQHVLSLTDREGRYSRLTRYVWLALCTGARKQAILQLRWHQVDFEQGVIDFRDQRPRSKKRRVPVPIADRLRPILLRAWHEQQGSLVLDSTTDVTQAWKQLVRNTSIEDVTLHDLRRTFATLLAKSGVNMWDIAGLLGDSVNVVTQHYAHHSPQYLRDAINARSN